MILDCAAALYRICFSGRGELSARQMLLESSRGASQSCRWGSLALADHFVGQQNWSLL